jgi:hypothetical protein
MLPMSAFSPVSHQYHALHGIYMEDLPDQATALIARLQDLQLPFPAQATFVILFPCSPHPEA